MHFFVRYITYAHCSFFSSKDDNFYHVNQLDTFSAYCTRITIGSLILRKLNYKFCISLHILWFSCYFVDCCNRCVSISLC
jgi:hypothetical protein